MIKGKMTGVQVVEKQEEYREQTMNEVVRMMNEGIAKAEVAEALAISNAEVDAIMKEAKRKENAAGRSTVRRFY